MTFFLIFPANRLWHFMQIVSSGDNLHECKIPFSWKISKCLLNFYPACYFYPPTLLHTYNLLKIKVPDTTAYDIFISFCVCFSEKIRLYFSCESAARHIIQGWLGEAKVLCILYHWAIQLILAYSLARPAILAVGKDRGGNIFISSVSSLSVMFLSPLPLSFIFSTISSISLLSFSG